LSLDYFFSDDKIFNKIRSKNLQQYVAPYKCIDMRDIAASFEISLDQVENELAD